jgi:hypothetical protein
LIDGSKSERQYQMSSRTLIEVSEIISMPERPTLSLSLFLIILCLQKASGVMRGVEEIEGAFDVLLLRRPGKTSQSTLSVEAKFHA